MSSELYLVTGATGATGRSAINHLLSRGAEVRARAIASRDLHSKHSSPIVFIESGLEPLVLDADLGGFVSAQ